MVCWLPSLLAHLEWWRGYYHFVRPHASLRVPLARAVVGGGRRLPRRYAHSCGSRADEL